MLSFHSLTDLIYPPACMLCRQKLKQAADKHQDLTLFCDGCNAAMRRCDKPLCRQCGIGIAAAFDAQACCRECQSVERMFSSACAPWQYSGPMKKAIQAFKYAQRWPIGNWLSLNMAQTAMEKLPLDKINLIVPVPYYWAQKLLKGFDATAYLGRRVAKILGKPFASRALSRTRWTRSQTQLPWPSRLSNMRNAFKANPAMIANQGILLVDDVLTSGATAENASLCLRQAGAREVFVITAARTPLN